MKYMYTSWNDYAQEHRYRFVGQYYGAGNEEGVANKEVRGP